MAESLSGLQSVLLLDQHERWQQGDRPQVESYLQVIPELGSDRRRLLDVIYQEILLREQAGESPSVEEYVTRFPALARELRLQFEVHVGLPPDGHKPADAHWPSRPEIEGYRIEAELGRGTFGVVYKAWEEKLKRQVAIKLLRPADDGEESSADVSLREAQSIARLVHPNIVQIYAVGETKEGIFFSQELVEGGTLTRLINGFSQPARSAAAFMATLADAVHYAHLCQVIHCDLKPSNILLRRKQVDGRSVESNKLQEVEPKVSDFGLALHLDVEGAAAGERLRGTLHYMAPEQTGGEAPTVGPATDVYALGAILYELLTGAPPFANDSKLNVFLKVRNEAPDDPRRLNPEVPADLNAICLKCLEKSPSRRYESAAALADDLRRFLSGHAPLAVETSRTGRVARWARRNPAVAGLLAALALVTAVGFAGVTSNMIEARRAEASERERADELDASLYRNKFLLARRAWEAKDVVAAQRILEETNPARRSFEWNYLYKLCTEASRRLPWEGDFIASIAYDPMGSQLVIWDGIQTIAVANVSTGSIRHRFTAHEMYLATPSISPDGTLVAAVEYEKGNSWIRLWNLKTGKPLRRIGSLLGAARAVAFSADGETLTTVSVLELFTKSADSLEIEVWETATGKRLNRVTATVSLDRLHLQVERYRAAVSPDGRTVAIWVSADPLVAPLLPLMDGAPAILRGRVSPLDHKVLLIDAQTGDSLEPLSSHTSFINSCTFSPDSGQLASVGIDGKAILWDAQTGRLVKVLQDEGESIRAATFSTDGTLLATGGNDLAITLWDANTGRQRRKLGGHDSPVQFVAFAPGNESLASAELKSEVRVWDLTSPLATMIREESNVCDLAWMEGGEALVYANLAGDLLVCDSASPKSTRREIGKALSIVLSDDRGQLASIDPEGHLLLGRKENPLKPEPVAMIPQLSNGCPTPFAFSPDGSLLACIEDGNERAFILDVAARGPLIHLPESKSGWTSVAFRHDGELVALGNKDRQIIFCNPTTGTIVRHVAAQFSVRDIVFRPGSDDLAAIGSVDRFVEIWSSTTGESRLVISGHRSQTDDLVFTPDGKRLITAGPGKTVTVWDADSGDELLVLDDAHDLPFHLAISADGRKLAAAAGQALTSGKIVVWDGSIKHESSD